MNRDEKFVHLHVHTEFSLLDGLSQIDRLMARAQELDMASIAITDHGVMYGVVDFFRAARNRSIKPIIGVEAYLARRTMDDRDHKLDRKSYHMLLLAKNQTGYQNLLKLASEAQLRGFYGVPRIDRETMAKYSEGLIATTGCLAAQIPQTIMNGQDDEARELIGWYQDVFGPENFFLELQYHDIDVLEDVNRWLAAYRKSGHTPVQLIATNDVHYVHKEDHDPHDTLLCIQTGNLKASGNRLQMSDASYHLTSHEEMAQAIGQHYDWLPEEMRFEALYNTAKVAAMCDVDLETEGYHLPRFPVPDGYNNEESYLRYLVNKGRHWRYGDDAGSPRYIERMEHELNIIHAMGFDTYFLIVWDLCEYARHADIWWNVRGSGAGSMVAYCLGITNLDPIQNSLIFERFLNPGRQTMPDIDLDYPDDRRADMIEYTARKYGSDKVAGIITFGTMGAKAAIRDVGRALDMPLSEVNQAASLIPTEARQKRIEEYVEANPDLKKLYRDNPRLREVIDTSKVLQGIARHASTHAAGVIVADKPLVEYVPLHRLTRGDDADSTLQQVTQFPMETCESLGLLKVDFLGLSTLTYMRRASDLIYKHHGIRWTLDSIPYRPHEGETLTEQQQRENQMLVETFQMIGDGNTIGVFQVESAGMQQMLRGMQPWKYEHIVAAVSLYRPGPMDYIPEFNARMHGEKEVAYHHEALRPILEETYGIITYQEQLMQIASDLFGYAMGDADLMRRAVSKKKQKELIKHKAIFLERGPENDIPVDVAEKIFDDIEFFANYGFNKCVVGDTQVVDAQTRTIHTVDDLCTGRVQAAHLASLDIDSGRIVSRSVEAVMYNGIKPVYRLQTAAGRTITATANHPFLVRDGWRLLGQLHVGDVIAAAPVIERLRQPMAAGSGGQRETTAVMWDEITAIEYAGEQPTYDLTIEGTHNFVANDIIVHNSHAADYAVITVQTAFLKRHYPAEYMAALLSVYRENSEKVATFLEECGRLNIPIMPPSVNHSHFDFDIQDLDDGRRGIRFGMAAVKNASTVGVEHIINRREEGGHFADLTDFCRRVDLREVGKRTLESLIKVEALDGFGANRAQLLDAIERMMTYSTAHHRAADAGQISMFGGDVAGSFEDDMRLPDIAPIDQRERLDWEHELLGFYITAHPVDDVRRKVGGANLTQTHHLQQLDEFDNERHIAMLGLIAGVREITTKNGDMMAVVALEDRHGTVEVVLFPRTWTRNKQTVRENADSVVLVRGKTDMRRGTVQIIADEVTTNFDMFTIEGEAPASDLPHAAPPLPEPPPPRHDVEQSAPQPASPVPPTPPSDIDWERELATDPHLNGDANAGSERWRVVVRFQTGADMQANVRRLHRLHGTFIEYPGSDEFVIDVVPQDAKPYRMTFPEYRTRASEELYNALVEIIGEENIHAEPLTP